jgi:DNA polymerase (family X)
VDGKRRAVEMLEELKELTLLDEGDPQAFRVRAYESAIHAIESLSRNPAEMTVAELVKLDGIGKSTASKLRELFDHGKVDKLVELRQKHPASVLKLMKIPGVGPKMVMKLRREVGVDSLDALKRAVAEGRLAAIKGFGKKTEENLARSLERMARAGDDSRTPISVALPLARRLVAELSSLPGATEAHYCGSLRRFSETVGDLDIVVVADAPGPIMDHVASMSFVAEVLAKGEAKTSVITQRGLQIDVRVVKQDQIGAALLYFTGSKSHNIKLRERALSRGLTLNEYALTEIATGKIVASRTEEEIYRALGLAWIHPVLREDMGEIAAAESGGLPPLLPELKNAGDFHVHTALSGDGHAALEELVLAAESRGYSFLAITEHAENLAMIGVKRAALENQRKDLAERQKNTAVSLLFGAELNIGAEGALDYDPEFRASFDFCLASIHDHFELSKEKQTARIVRAMEDPDVHMIGHLTARMIGARPPIDLDVPAVLDAAERTGTALEINGGLPRLDLTLDVLRALRGRDVRVVLTSDAHKVGELDRTENAALHALRAWIEPKQIVNYWEPPAIRAWLGDKRARSAAINKPRA